MSRQVVDTAVSSSHRLRRLSMKENCFCLEFFATRFSALRYGCPITTDVTTYVEKSNNGNNEYKDYWRWLAFGLFYPRPRQFASRLHLRDIGHIKHCPLSVDIFSKTVRNPASELIFDGKTEQGDDDVQPTRELLVCAVKKGATVRLFQTENSKSPEWTDTFSMACELEAIYERGDGSVCVVVPGVGLGWIRADCIDRIEREPLSAERSEQDGVYAVDLGYDVKWRSDNWNVWDWNHLVASVQTLVETFGRQFWSLTLLQDRYPVEFLPIVLKYCTKLTHLDISNHHLDGREYDPLLDALGGTLGDRLQVLNLNYADRLTRGFFERFFSILGDTEDSPALRELRIKGQLLTLKQREAMRSVLDVNSTLEVIEIQSSGGYVWWTGIV